MILWAEHDGGYDADTWYWGALLLLALTAGLIVVRGVRGAGLTRSGRIALGAFALYVAWSYLSITWAAAPGTALEGSNRALLYLIIFALMAGLPWSPRAALIALVVFAVGIGVLALTILLRLAGADHVGVMIVSGRLEATTGYFNASAALFTICGLTATGLATRRELPGLLRGLLIGLASAGLQLAVTAQSRGWLFTLPIVVIIAVIVVPDRLRFVGAAILPVAAALIPARQLIRASQFTDPSRLSHAAQSAAKLSLVLCTVMLVLATVVAWTERLIKPPSPSVATRRLLGAAATVVILAACVLGVFKATHGDPVGFATAQWNGFSHESAASDSGSHFSTVGSGRYDFWRSSLEAFTSHPIGGLGQDNFGDYYLLHRHTSEEPSWTHSLEMRLLAHTGIVGFALFFAFLIAALTLARRARRSADPVARAATGIALLPLIVWFVHGSLDWFWEIPALTGPALGFLGMACSLAARPAIAPEGSATAGRTRSPALVRVLPAAAGMLALVAATGALGASYLSVREVSMGADASATNTSVALTHLARAADLNPLSSVPGRLAGAYALRAGLYAVAAQRFAQSTTREPGGWFAWLGAGLAASAQGHARAAHSDFQTADRIDARQPAVSAALSRVYGRHPLTSAEAFTLLSTAS
ncbi:MAG: O-antigen ligase family protein [Solirubrobacteraceae bacterium]